jgi:probable blue pigment (indigoidine) exporter
LIFVELLLFFLMDIIEGVLFALFWASATVATKFAIRSVDPFLLTFLRFSLVSLLLLIHVYVIKRKDNRLPQAKELKHLLVLGVCNVTLYMTGYLIAIKTISAGLISLATASNPLILILLSAVFLDKKPTIKQWIGIAVSVAGLVLASIPNLRHSHLTIKGLVALIAGILALSSGSVYYSKVRLALPKMVVNTWQITIGGLLFAPILWLNRKNNFIKPDLNFSLSFIWLVVPVSIIAYSLWLTLVHKDPVKAGGWLFLTPVLGYLMAIVILHEPITIYGVSGALMVVLGLMYSRRPANQLPRS